MKAKQIIKTIVASSVVITAVIILNLHTVVDNAGPQYDKKSNVRSGRDAAASKNDAISAEFGSKAQIEREDHSGKDAGAPATPSEPAGVASRQIGDGIDEEATRIELSKHGITDPEVVNDIIAGVKEIQLIEDMSRDDEDED